jgi:hypothetical protein
MISLLCNCAASRWTISFVTIGQPLQPSVTLGSGNAQGFADGGGVAIRISGLSHEAPLGLIWVVVYPSESNLYIHMCCNACFASGIEQARWQVVRCSRQSKMVPDETKIAETRGPGYRLDLISASAFPFAVNIVSVKPYSLARRSDSHRTNVPWFNRRE